MTLHASTELVGAKVRCFHFWQAFQESGQALDAKMDALAAALRT